jgi:signal transduction histidine kinase
MPKKRQTKRKAAGVTSRGSGAARRGAAKKALRDRNEELERRVGERTASLAMLCDVASMANDAADVESALVYILKRFSEHNGWRCGYAWLPADDDPSELLPGYGWYEDAPACFDRLNELVLATRARRGRGMVGRVFCSGEVECASNISADLLLAAEPSGESLGVESVCAFPLLCREEIVGVMGFFSDARIRVTEEIRRSMATVGTLLGRVIERQRIERTLRGLNEKLERRGRDLRRLAAQLSEAEHRERSRLARLLHDDLQQVLVAARMRLPLLGEGTPDQVEQHVAKIDELIATAQTTARDLSHELSPPVLRSGGLSDVLEWLGKWFRDKCELTVAVKVSDSRPPAPEHLRVFLFQATRELLLNVVKHSGSTEARVTLSHQNAHLVVQVEDGGEDFDAQAVEARLHSSEGLGLFGIRERVEAVGGRFEIQTTPRGGACFRLLAPITGGHSMPDETRRAQSALDR